MSVDFKSRFSVRDGVVLREIDGASVLFSVESGKYFGLEGVSRDIWQGIEDGLSVGEIADRLSQSYAVSPTDCQGDVLEFAKSLCEASLVEVLSE